MKNALTINKVEEDCATLRAASSPGFERPLIRLRWKISSRRSATDGRKSQKLNAV